MWTINTLTKWHAKWKWNGMKNSTGKQVKHVELINECIDLMRNRDIKFLKVKSHVNIYQNEMSDKLADEGAEIDKVLYNI